MAHIAPFRALRYDPTRVSIPQVVTQPYDKITPEMQDAYYGRSPYNLVRIILGKSEPGDNDENNTHSRAAAYYRDWRRQGIFVQDSHPSIYTYTQRFTPPGGKGEVERRGFIALGRLEDYSNGVVFRHEQTLAKPKADRLELLRAARGHFGQLFMLYSDPAGEIDNLLVSAAAPEIECSDDYGVLHRVWKVADSSLINLVRGKMREKKLIIADGHHRYETALAYRDERRETTSPLTPGIPRIRSLSPGLLAATDSDDAPYELAMMTFVNMDSPGLCILPTHRVVHGLGALSSGEFRSHAGNYFSVEEVDPAIDADRATVVLREAGRMGTALLAVLRDRAFLLDRPNPARDVMEGVSLRQQALDVVQLHKVLLERALGLTEESIREQRNLRYVRDAADALNQVRAGAADIAFLMNPVRMRQVSDIALAGEVLPQKSTDFYPKLLSGLTIYALE